VSETPRSARPIRDRDVLLTAALVVAGVLIVARVTGFVPALDDAIGLEPLIIVFLVIVTIAVMVIALRPKRS
jgi:hypothetical protein